MGPPTASKPEVPSSTPGSSCLFLVFINKLINDKSNRKKNMLLFVLYCDCIACICRILLYQTCVAHQV